MRLLGFFTMIIFFVPVHVIYSLFPSHNIYLFPKLFHRLLIKIMSFKIRTHGAISSYAPTLFVCNHTSYLDIPVLGSLLPACFIAKAEVASWPLIGVLSKLQNTVFIERRSNQINEQRDKLKKQFAMGRSLILFPEGTSSEGTTVLPFKSGLFSIVEETRKDMSIMVQAVSITATELKGLPLLQVWRPYYAWFGDMTFVKHLWDVFSLGDFTVDVVFHPPIEANSIEDRKAFALFCQQQVAHGNELSLIGPKRLEKGHKAQLAHKEKN